MDFSLNLKTVKVKEALVGRMLQTGGKENQPHRKNKQIFDF